MTRMQSFTKRIGKVSYQNHILTFATFLKAHGCAPWLVDEGNFEIHQICILYLKTFTKKNFINQLCKNHLKINYVKFRIHALKDHLCFNKKFTNQALTLKYKQAIHYTCFVLSHYYIPLLI